MMQATSSRIVYCEDMLHGFVKQWILLLLDVLFVRIYWYLITPAASSTDCKGAAEAHHFFLLCKDPLALLWTERSQPAGKDITCCLY